MREQSYRANWAVRPVKQRNEVLICRISKIESFGLALSARQNSKIAQK